MSAHEKNLAKVQLTAPVRQGADSLTWESHKHGDNKSSMVIQTPGANASPPSAPTGIYRIVEADC